MQNKNTTIIIILLIIIAVILAFIALKKPRTQVAYQIPTGDTAHEKDTENSYIDDTHATYTYKNHGFTMELPMGYVPQEIQGETGPTISIELPSGWLVYITDATLWEKYNLIGQTDYLRDEKIGNTQFKVYKYTGQATEFYYFRKGNVAFMFNADMLVNMRTFNFIGWN